jgi:hypothetical protein
MRGSHRPMVIPAMQPDQSSAADDIHVACWICRQLVRLTECRVDEDGHAVHEPCYVTKLNRERNPAGD